MSSHEEGDPPRFHGTEVHVYKEGRLYVKSSFLGTKRACEVEIRGTRLSICQGDQKKTKIFNLERATLLKQEGQRRLVIHLANKEKLSLYAADINVFWEWVEALTDSVQWKVQRFYDIGQELGRGAYAVVRKAKHKATGDIVAIKIIGKNDRSEEDLKYMQREIDIARSIRHRNVVQTSDIFESESKLYIVLEYMSGGTLQKFVDKNGPLNEDVARQVMWDILSAVEHLHRDGVVHRDIKPENMLCSRKKAPMVVKLMDFGLSRLTKEKAISSGTTEHDSGLGPNGLMVTPVGTPSYVAPEILMTLPYGKEVDIFACGIVMYWLLCGYLPFDHSDAQEVMELIKKTEFGFPEDEWSKISKSAKHLISRMLDRSPYARISATDALSHPWIAAAQSRDKQVENVAEADASQSEDFSLADISNELQVLQDKDQNDEIGRFLHSPTLVSLLGNPAQVRPYGV